MSFVALAEKVPCSHQYLRRRIERGAMSDSLFRRVCSILDLDLSDMLTPEDWIPPSQETPP